MEEEGLSGTLPERGSEGERCPDRAEFTAGGPVVRKYQTAEDEMDDPHFHRTIGLIKAVSTF